MIEMARWAWTQLVELFGHEAFAAGALALALGIAFTDFIARMLPPRIDVDFAKRIVRLTVFGVSTIAAFWLNPTPLGMVVAFTAGAGAPAIQLLMMRAIYARWPSMKPEALIPNCDDRPPPPSLVKPS